MTDQKYIRGGMKLAGWMQGQQQSEGIYLLKPL